MKVKNDEIKAHLENFNKQQDKDFEKIEELTSQNTTLTNVHEELVKKHDLLK